VDGNVQSTFTRISRGAPDFETIAENLDWEGPSPSYQNYTYVYSPIRSLPGWTTFRQSFFLRADATVCVPSTSDLFRIETFHKGRVRVLVNDQVVIEDVRFLFGHAFRTRIPEEDFLAGLYSFVCTCPSMAPKTEGCLYPCWGGACDPMAMGGIPPEAQFCWLSGRYLIMSFL
jgi:hypothetical protein